LNTTAHLSLILYRLAGKEFLLTNLYIDLMIMIKNAIFSIAKAVIDNPKGEFWLILLGTNCTVRPKGWENFTFKVIT